MNYNEAVEYLYGIPRFSKKTTKENTLNMLKLLGNPQEGFEIFHVAGTNGKGSVCAFVNQILLEAGINTGLFTSPHLLKPNERIKINGSQITDDEFLDAFITVKNMISENEKNGIVHPSFFEFIFLMAMVVFQNRKVDVVILEVGLGGRLDATNVISKKLVSVITSLSLEHTEILGETIEEIAAQKAGIIKEGDFVVADATNKEALKVIKEIAKSKAATLCTIDENNVKIIKKEDKNIDFSLDSSYYVNDKLQIAFLAPYQTINASLACVAVVAARKKSKLCSCITDEDIRRGIMNTGWEGRMECIKEGVYVDGAHNVAGVKAFIEAVKSVRTGKDRYLLFSVVREKNYKEMIQLLVEEVSWKHIYISGIETERAEDVQLIKQTFFECGYKEVTALSNTKEAFLKATSAMENGDSLFCAGSLYLVGELKSII